MTGLKATTGGFLKSRQITPRQQGRFQREWSEAKREERREKENGEKQTPHKQKRQAIAWRLHNVTLS
ncbi:hypothetical protein [Pseudoteredinibacter isoporae]|uniref:hypothetical protein n=1 Tax=Pseudoteredinibacter isoporae TaxID=570281 RepID=UPI00333F7D3E